MTLKLLRACAASAALLVLSLSAQAADIPRPRHPVYKGVRSVISYYNWTGFYSGINGAAAHLVHPGDLVIILTYEGVPSELVDTYRPRLVHVDTRNRIVERTDHIEHGTRYVAVSNEEASR